MFARRNRARPRLKAAIVIEHLIQALAVSDIMQHCLVFSKWNKRLFLECHKAFLDGSTDNDPLETWWYQDEIGFFDFRIIPLAKKLKELGVFQVTNIFSMPEATDRSGN